MLVVCCDLINMILAISLLSYGVFKADAEEDKAKPILDQYCQLQDNYPTT